MTSYPLSSVCARMIIKNTFDAKNSIMASFGNGRLGNQMCNFASQYALYKDFQILSYLGDFSYNILQNAFNLPRQKDKYAKSEFYHWKTQCVDPRILKWVYISNTELMYNRKSVVSQYKYSHYIKLPPYVCDIKGFIPYIKELRGNIFRFKPKDMEKADKIFQKLMTKISLKNVVLISIHIRMGDMENHLTTVFNISTPSRSYFTMAMQYMREKFGKDIVFVAFSDNISRAKPLLFTTDHNQHNIRFPVFDVTRRKPYVILRLLSLCKHSILTYSTFGLWGALLEMNQGETILPKEIKDPDIGNYVSNANIVDWHFI